MSEDSWIEASEALQMLRDALGRHVENAPDIARWAEEGLVRTQSRKLRTVERNGTEHWASDGALSREFWRLVNKGRDHAWMAGEAGIRDWNEREWVMGEFTAHDRGLVATAYGVEFASGDIVALLPRTRADSVSPDSKPPSVADVGSPPAPAQLSPPPPRWQQQRVSQQQERVFKFFEFASSHLPGGDRKLLSGLELHKRYLEWHAKQPATSGPYARTGFEKMLDRRNAGWLINDRRWEMPH